MKEITFRVVYEEQTRHNRACEKQPQAHPPPARLPALPEHPDLPNKSLPPWPAWPPNWPEIQASVDIVLQDGQWGQYHAEVTQRLSQQIADQFRSPHVQLCCSGTAAIELALRAGGLKPEDEVMLAAFDFPGNFRTIELLGLRPVLVDCRPDSVQIDSQQLLDAASPQTRAVIVSQLYGTAVDLSSLRDWADNHKILLIEDACHCPGAVVAGKTVGTTGHVGVISFGGSKTLTSGNGGAILTADPRIAQRAQMIAQRPSDATPLSALQAAALLPQLNRLEELANRRRQNAASLAQRIESLSTLGFSNFQLTADGSPDSLPDYYKFAFLTPDETTRNRSATRAAEAGFPLRAGYRSSSRVSPRRCRRPPTLPHAERLGKCLLTIDHPVLLADPQQSKAIEALLDWLLTHP